MPLDPPASDEERQAATEAITVLAAGLMERDGVVVFDELVLFWRKARQSMPAAAARPTPGPRRFL